MNKVDKYNVHYSRIRDIDFFKLFIRSSHYSFIAYFLRSITRICCYSIQLLIQIVSKDFSSMKINALYTIFDLSQEPLFICGKGPFYEFLIENLPILKHKFWPTLWCFESRAQTIFASIGRTQMLPVMQYRRYEIMLYSSR